MTPVDQEQLNTRFQILTTILISEHEHKMGATVLSPASSLIIEKPRE